jgi:type I restriction enzyme M protein
MISAPPGPPVESFADGGKSCHRVGSWLWIPLRNRWSDVTHKPEEVVRQEWVRRLVVEGGFELEQMDQEVRSLAHGHGSPRADIVVWPSARAKANAEASILVVETKAAEGPVLVADFVQGNSYARVGGAGFLICATATTHAVFELPPGLPAQVREINEWPKKLDFADERRLRKLRESLRVFDRDEFQKLLVACHNVLRDAQAMGPIQAFDTISKVLFIKLYIERSGNHGTFTTKFLDDRERTRVEGEQPVHESLFDLTREAYAADDLFDDNELGISAATFRELVAKLERFNLSQTGEDVKGIAFEQFLGRTFRGELGQFFTPRPVVNFMVEALDPREGELVCDPAAGSGGFLIRVFDHVRDLIATDIAAQKEGAVAAIYAEYAEDAPEDKLAERDERAEVAREELNADLAPFRRDGGPANTRVGRLARDCIYGTDKESRAARTAKMNMIMHGDGHGGIHWHDGLIDINGIWENRFHVVVTNPPFGSSVKKTLRVGDTSTTDVPSTATYTRQQNERYGDAWRLAHAGVVANRGKSILSLYEVGEGRGGSKTEILFLERCLDLLKPGGRLAIVLPNGNLNGASVSWLRRWAEGKAFLRGVVVLPMETFKFSGASVSASVVFMQKFRYADTMRWQAAWAEADAALAPEFAQRRAEKAAFYATDVIDGGDDELKEILTDLRALGGDRVLPELSHTEPTGIERGAGTTRIGSPRWTGPSRGDAAALRRKYTERAADVPAVAQALANLKAELAALDDEQTKAMWSHVRETFDYPVFMARPAAVGITATGDTGEHVPNDLPEVLAEWKAFIAPLTADEAA